MDETSWTCACGRECAAERSKCPACGDPRSGAPASPARRDAPVDPALALPPNPADGPAVALLSRSLLLQVPRACVCCLGPPDSRPIEARVSTRDVEWGRVASTALGLLTAAVTGFGWYHTRHTAKGLETRLRCPACDFCRQHEESGELAGLIGGAVALGGALLTLLVLGGAPRPGTAALVFGVWSVAGVMAFVAAAAKGAARRRPGCTQHHAVRVVVRRSDDTFKVVFGNRSYGRRVAELNPDLVFHAR